MGFQERQNDTSSLHSILTTRIDKDELASESATRNETPANPLQTSFESDAQDSGDVHAQLQLLASEIAQELSEPVSDETIRLCGPAPLQIISSLPDEVLSLAYDKLSTWPYSEVPTCWRRLYEDASLYKTIGIVQSETDGDAKKNGAKRRRLNPPSILIDQLVSELDKGLTISGAPGRQDVFEFAFQQLDSLIDDEANVHEPLTFSICRPDDLDGKNAISRVDEPLSFDLFQSHLTKKTTPLVIPGTFTHWPAFELWQDPEYLLRLTLGGRRLVPVEIGRSYTDEGWSQRVMPFREFMQKYLLPESPEEIGYLAQHDLFAQIAALRNDIAVPDYCFTTPPVADSAVRKTAGLSDARKLETPMLNAWLGPKGTKTPLHTDPYHNVLCQVVGYKYIRLYPPDQVIKVYPRGLDEKGISMANTSRVDVSLVRPTNKDGTVDPDLVKRIKAEFPLFDEATYQETILGPGECLYIPMGWWHYVESVSASFSVSFWWN